MDTSTHAIMGVTLAGLSLIDPQVAASSSLQVATAIGVIVGSQAPDFDVVLKLRSNSHYIRGHRGLSHGLFIAPLWAIAISLVIQRFHPLELGAFAHVFGWTLLAVMVHIFVDLFNTYGTQALQPFSKKWIAWHTMPIFDPYFFAIHLVGAALWLIGLGDPRIIFTTVYVGSALFIGWRMWIRRRVQSSLSMTDPYFAKKAFYGIVPTTSLRKWHLVKRLTTTYEIGEFKQNVLTWHKRVACEVHPLIDKSRATEAVQALLHVSPLACPQLIDNHTVVWRDLRYVIRRQFPFIAKVEFDSFGNVSQQWTGWLKQKEVAASLRDGPPPVD